jgi:hypothetical protein
MMHLTEDDLYDEVEGIISAADFIEKPKAPNCCSSDRRHACTVHNSLATQPEITVAVDG